MSGRLTCKEDNMSMTKKAVTMLAVFLTAFALIAAAVPMVMAQASNPTVLFTGRKNLSGAFVISDSSVVPEGSTLYVKKGGKLYIKSGAGAFILDFTVPLHTISEKLFTTSRVPRPNTFPPLFTRSVPPWVNTPFFCIFTFPVTEVTAPSPAVRFPLTYTAPPAATFSVPFTISSAPLFM